VASPFKISDNLFGIPMLSVVSQKISSFPIICAMSSLVFGCWPLHTAFDRIAQIYRHVSRRGGTPPPAPGFLAGMGRSFCGFGSFGALAALVAIIIEILKEVVLPFANRSLTKTSTPGVPWIASSDGVWSGMRRYLFLHMTPTFPRSSSDIVAPSPSNVSLFWLWFSFS